MAHHNPTSNSSEKSAAHTMDETTPEYITEVIYGGEDKLPPPPNLTPQEERRLWRKIDMRIMPIATSLYLCSFLDRSNIGNAKLQGLTTQLNLTGSKYNVALTMFFIAFNVFSIPSNLVFKTLRPSRFLPSVTVTWGTITTLMGLVHTYPQLVGVRICLGVAEAGMVCGVFYLFSLWYPRHMVQTRIGMFWAGGTCAGAFSGLLAFAISYMSGREVLLGWSWIFIIEGCATVLVGIIAYFVVVDLPDTAAFLTPEERAYVVHRKKFDNSSVGEEEHFEARHIKEALLDWQVWLLCFINMADTTAVYGISLFLPSIINGFGYDPTISQLLTVPVYVVATIVVMVWAVLGDRIKMRSPFDLAGLTLCLIGYGINISNASIGAKYFGTYLCAMGGYGAFPATNAWMSNNVSGHYKRAVGFGFIVMWGNFGGIIASNVYRAEDAPRYVFGHGMEILFIGLGMIATVVTAATYMRINARREAQLRDAVETGRKPSVQETRRLGDRALDFRYTL